MFREAIFEIYDFVRSSFKRSPKTPCYIWSLRDVSKVFQGLTLALDNKGFNASDLQKLFAHELQRVFEDKLQLPLHRQVFRAALRDSMQHFRRRLEEEPARFLKTLVGVVKSYEKVQSEEEMLKTFQDSLQELRLREPNPSPFFFSKPVVDNLCRAQTLHPCKPLFPSDHRCNTWNTCLKEV